MEEKISQNGTDDAQDKKAKKAAKHDGGVADLERVTDYAEEKELSSADISNVRMPYFNLNPIGMCVCLCYCFAKYTQFLICWIILFVYL